MGKASYDDASRVITESLKHKSILCLWHQYAQILITKGDNLYRMGEATGALEYNLKAKDFLIKARLDDRYEQVPTDLLAKIESRIRKVCN